MSVCGAIETEGHKDRGDGGHPSASSPYPPANRLLCNLLHRRACCRAVFLKSVVGGMAYCDGLLLLLWC